MIVAAFSPPLSHPITTISVTRRPANFSQKIHEPLAEIDRLVLPDMTKTVLSWN
jgi:hypothetical protein